LSNTVVFLETGASEALGLLITKKSFRRCDFDPTADQPITETVKTLARMSRFVIADLTDARSIPQELQIIDTHCRTVAIRLIKKRGAREYGMLDFRTPWFVNGRYEYEGLKELIAWSPLSSTVSKHRC
jgi:hypothetical protein